MKKSVQNGPVQFINDIYFSHSIIFSSLFRTHVQLNLSSRGSVSTSDMFGRKWTDDPGPVDAVSQRALCLDRSYVFMPILTNLNSQLFAFFHS